MASLSFPALVPPQAVAPPMLPPVAPVPPVGAVAAAAQVALLQAEAESPPLPASQAAPGLAQDADAAADGAAMRPDQVAMARQLTWPSADGGALAGAWRGMVRGYGAQLVARELQARSGQLPGALLQAQDARVLRQGLEQGGILPPDAWRFTVHAGAARPQHLRVVEGEPEEQKETGRQRRRRARAALRLELVLADGSVATVEAEALADGLVLRVCALDAAALERLRALQPELEAALDRAGLRVLRWSWRDTLPEGRVHARLPSADAAAALSLPVFRAMAELALQLPLAPRLR